ETFELEVIEAETGRLQPRVRVSPSEGEERLRLELDPELTSLQGEALVPGVHAEGLARVAIVDPQQALTAWRDLQTCRGQGPAVWNQHRRVRESHHRAPAGARRARGAPAPAAKTRAGGSGGALSRHFSSSSMRDVSRCNRCSKESTGTYIRGCGFSRCRSGVDGRVDEEGSPGRRGPTTAAATGARLGRGGLLYRRCTALPQWQTPGLPRSCRPSRRSPPAACFP